MYWLNDALTIKNLGQKYKNKEPKMNSLRDNGMTVGQLNKIGNN